MHEAKGLKILFLPGWYPSENNAVYGIFVKEHAKAVKLYNDIIVLYNEGGDTNFKKLWGVFSDKKEEGIRTLRIRHKELFIPKIGFFIFLYSIFISFGNLINTGWRPDIIHAHGLSAALAAVILGIKHKLPVVITEHWTGFPRHSLRFIDILTARFAMNRARVIMPVSKDLGQAIQSYGIKSKIEVIPNVVDTGLFQPTFNKNNINKNKKLKKEMLIVATLSPQKGIPYLFNALTRLKEKRHDFILNIVGGGPSQEEYQELATNLALTNIVKFHGTKTKIELAEFMRTCDFFVLPSLWENSPCVLIEALASGLPLIATDVGGVGEIVNESTGILLPSKDVEALELKINYMLDHYQNYSSKTLYEYAKTNYSYAAVGKNLNQIYKQIINVKN